MSRPRGIISSIIKIIDLLTIWTALTEKLTQTRFDKQKKDLYFNFISLSTARIRWPIFEFKYDWIDVDLREKKDLNGK